jgi:hypothetical protein
MNTLYHNETAKRNLKDLNDIKLDDTVKDLEARHKNWPVHLELVGPESTTKTGSPIPAQRKAGHTATWTKMERLRTPRDLKEQVLGPPPQTHS